MAPDPVFDLTGKKLWVAGETGLAGSAIIRRLYGENIRLLSAPHQALDLTRQSETEAWMDRHKPDIVILAAAKVGGIGANSVYPADFIQSNLAIAQNVIHGAYKTGVEKLIFLGSSCIYPKFSPQPIKEEYLLSGTLEETNEYYALAKIAGLKLCQAFRRQHGCDFISVMPTNLYGPCDRFDAAASHVIPAMILKMHQAKEKRAAVLELWGTGNPLREFLYIDDFADAVIHVLKHYSQDAPINIGSGQEISIHNLAFTLKEIVGYRGEIVFNPDYPDGTPRKLLDCTRLNDLGWEASTSLHHGLSQTYEWFLRRIAKTQAA